MKPIPAKALTTFWPPNLSAGSDFPEVFDPYNDISRSEPHMRQAVIPTPVPLSGFFNLSAVSKQVSKFVALFRATAVPGTPLQSVPLAKSAHPSRGHYSPAVIHPCAGTHHSRTCHRRFPRHPRSHAVAWFPRRLWSPFPQTRLLASRFSWFSGSEVAPFRELHLLRSLIPSANPFARAQVAPDTWPLLSWVFCPFRAFSSRASSPRPAQARKLEHVSSPEGLEPRPKGPLDPSRRVRLPSTPKHRSRLSAVPDPLRDRTAPPLGGASSPSTLELTRQA